jgi:hypothetical protein
MPHAHFRRRALPPAAALILLLAGCASSPSPPPLEPAPAVGAPAAAAPAPPPPAEPAARLVPKPDLVRAEIALVHDASAPAHAAVAEEIAAALSPRLYRVARFSAADALELGALRDRPVTVVAVGAQAVRTARTALPGKRLVFCQMPASDNALTAGTPAWGVQTLPPLKLQLQSWQAIDPSLRTIALIVSASGAALAAEAQRAADLLAADLIVETSASDRETLYRFRRLATTVDGLWLLPDNDALSPQVLQELLGYASSRGIGVLTFNEALLARGALLSAAAVPADVAATVAHVVERVVAGRTAELRPLTPLSAAAFTLNLGLAATLGLPPVAEPRWVAREPD